MIVCSPRICPCTGNATYACSRTPIQVVGLTNVVAVAAGYWHSLALKSDGSVWAWGYNGNGELGDNTTTQRNTPIQVHGPNNVGFLSGMSAVVATDGDSHSLKSDGTVWNWGYNGNGNLGDNTTTVRRTPVEVHGPGNVGYLTGIIQLAGGDSHSLALKSDGTIWAWGNNIYGELGDGTTTLRSTPVQTSSPSGLTALAGGNYVSLAAATVNQQTISYTYDRLYRLTGDETRSYAYDPVGNRASLTQNGVTSSYGYDRADRLTTAGSVAYTVNANGDVTARGTDSFAYDQANRLTSATVGGMATTNVYDGDGKRASQTVGSNAAIAYVYDVAGGLTMLPTDGTRKYVYGLGLAYSVDTAGTLSVYHADGLGSVREQTNAAGTVTSITQTDAFGVPLTPPGTSSSQPFGFAGEQRDSDGLMYLRARYYDPAIGRFMSRDPLAGGMGFPQSLNRYSYALNNPVSNIDPSGLCSDPGPSATGPGYCIERFIPTAYAKFPTKGDVLFRGDNRGASESSSVAYRVNQSLYEPGASQVGLTTVGFTRADTAFRAFSGRGTLYSSVTTVKSNVLGERTLHASSAASIGILPPYTAPPILTNVWIEKGANGNADVS